jgi:hypothetical protein
MGCELPPGDFLVDVETHDKNNILRRLNQLKSVVVAEDDGAYHQDTSYSRLLVRASLTEDELDSWLSKNNFDYVGVVPSVEEHHKKRFLHLDF